MAEEKRTLHIVCDGDDPTIRFAADELRRCLNLATGWEADGECTCDDINDIHVGPSSVYGVDMPGVADPDLDDAVRIEVRNGGGYIAGINPRSVLLAVYRYLTQLGCRWVRPGKDGEYIPKLDRLADVDLTRNPLLSPPWNLHRGRGQRAARDRHGRLDAQARLQLLLHPVP